MRALFFAALLATSAVARAQDAATETAPLAPAAAPAEAVAAEPAPAAAPRAPELVATEAARAAFEASIRDEQGLARAERLLAFIAEYPDDPSVRLRAGEAARLVAEAGKSASLEPLVEQLAQVFLEGAEEARAAKVRALAALGQARAVPAIGYVARRDASLAVRSAAATVLGDLPSPESERAALAIANDGKEKPEVRAAAAGALGRQGTVSAGDELVRLALDVEQPAMLRQSATDALVAHYPAIAEKHRLEARVADSSGRALGTIVGAASGAYTLGLVGSLSQNEEVGVLVGVFGGLVIGGASSYLLGRTTGLDDGDAALLLGAGAWSVPVGWFLGRTVEGPEARCDTKGCNAMALGTHVAALGAAWYAKDRLDLGIVDNVEANVGALSGLFLSLGTVIAAKASRDDRPGWLLMAAGPTAGFVAGAAYAKDLRLTPQLAGLTLFAGAEGAFASGMLSAALVPDEVDGPLGSRIPNQRKDDLVSGLSFLGFGAGLGGMLAASAFWQPTPSDAGLLFYSALDGNLLGAAIPLLVAGSRSGDDPGETATMVGTALGGFAAATATGLLTKRLALGLKGGDALLVGLGMGFATWQGIGWSIYLDDLNVVTNTGRSVGLALGTIGFSGTALLAASQQFDMTNWQAGWAFSGAVWGGWLAGWTAYVLDLRGISILGWALAGSDLGLLASAMLLSPIVDVDPNTLAWVSVFGVGGMTLATMVATFAAYDSPGKPVATANVVGTIAGMALGAVLAPRLPGVRRGSGGDDGPGWLDGLSLPTASAMPVLDPSGTKVDGVGAQLVWAM